MAYDLSMYELTEEDENAYPAWFADLTHQSPAWTPMALTQFLPTAFDGLAYGTAQLSFPTSRGIALRIQGNLYYATAIPVTDPEEIKSREPLFREKLRPCIENFPKMWDQHREEIEGYFEKLDPVDVTKLSDIDLICHLNEQMRVDHRGWEIHHFLMEACVYPYILFEDLSRELVGLDDTTPLFHHLLTGYENVAFDVDKMMWGLADRAIEFKLADTFLKLKAEEVVPALEQTEAGRKWLAELNEFLNVWGKRMTQLCNCGAKTWIEDPSVPILRMQGFLKKGGTFKLDEERKRLAQQREEARKEVLAKIPAEQRSWYEVLMRCAQNAAAFSETHAFWIEEHNDYLARRCIQEFGRRLVKAKTIEHPDDIWYISFEDLLRVMHAPHLYNLRPRVQDLKARWEHYREEPPPQFITKLSPPEAVGWLAQTKHGILNKIVVGAAPRPKADVKADLWGTCGGPGVAEGIARVIFSEDQFSEVQPGDILVAPMTTLGWTALFPLLAGAVCDVGGSLQHAAICSREYGIPCVQNTFVATQKIKSGQRIRVDANIGAVYILE